MEQYCILLAASKHNSSSGISTVGTLSSASNVEQRKKGDKGAHRERETERENKRGGGRNRMREREREKWGERERMRESRAGDGGGGGGGGGRENEDDHTMWTRSVKSVVAACARRGPYTSLFISIYGRWRH